MNNPLSPGQYLKRTVEKQSDTRGEYFRDQTAIIHSMPFRRLKHKTQVFFAPENDHVCTRIEHVMHVATIAKSICKGLNVNGWNLEEEMAFAIGLGHDLGHAPFGHDGESILNKRLGGNNAFVHEINSYRVVEKLTNDGKGLNLTYGVKDGIITHNGEHYEQFLQPIQQINDLDNIKSRNVTPSSYEGCIVRFSDKIAYLGRDIEDAIVAGYISREDIPTSVREKFGDNNSDIINTLVMDMIETSKNLDKVGFSDECFELLKKLRDFNYKNIYHNEKRFNFKHYADKLINTIFDYLLELYSKFGRNYAKYEKGLLGIKLDSMFGNYLKEMDHFYAENENPNIIITDYIAGMTDLYALESMKQITIPKAIFFK